MAARAGRTGAVRGEAFAHGQLRIDRIIQPLERGLIERPELFARTLTQKLFTFALGRGMEPYDAPAVRRVIREAAANDFRFSSIVLGIAKSVPFQMRMKSNAKGLAAHQTEKPRTSP